MSKTASLSLVFRKLYLGSSVNTPQRALSGIVGEYTTRGFIWDCRWIRHKRLYLGSSVNTPQEALLGIVGEYTTRGHQWPFSALLQHYSTVQVGLRAGADQWAHGPSPAHSQPWTSALGLACNQPTWPHEPAWLWTPVTPANPPDPV